MVQLALTREDVSTVQQALKVFYYRRNNQRQREGRVYTNNRVTINNIMEKVVYITPVGYVFEVTTREYDHLLSALVRLKRNRDGARECKARKNGSTSTRVHKVVFDLGTKIVVS